MDTMYITDLDARKTPGGTLQPGEVPIGTGPYTWKSRQEGTSLTFEKNAATGVVSLRCKRLQFKVINEPEQAAIALETGEVDVIVNNVPVQSLPKLREDPNIQVLHAEGSYFFQGYMNFEKARRGGYVDPVKVHQGLAYLATPKRIIPPLIGDFGSLAHNPLRRGNSATPTRYSRMSTTRPRVSSCWPRAGSTKVTRIRLLAGGSRPYLCEWATDTQSNLKRLGYDAQLQCLANEVDSCRVHEVRMGHAVLDHKRQSDGGDDVRTALGHGPDAARSRTTPTRCVIPSFRL